MSDSSHEADSAHGTQTTPGVAILPPRLYLGVLSVGFLLHALYPIRLLPRALSLLLSAFTTGGGLLFMFSALREMRRVGTNVSPHAPTTSLITNGPYKVSRNPIYIGLTLLYSGAALFVNSLYPFALLPGLLVVLQRGVIEREERYLERIFGEAYMDYRKRVRRWL